MNADPQLQTNSCRLRTVRRVNAHKVGKIHEVRNVNSFSGSNAVRHKEQCARN
jgi:hypothetical protein